MASDERAAVYVGKDPKDGAYWKVRLDGLRAALSAQGLHIVTAAEKRVLEAMAQIREEAVRIGANVGMMGGVSELCRAELARRGEKGHHQSPG